MDSVGALLPFVLILVAFYALIIRPARKRQSAQSRLVDSLEVGQKVMTTSGMYAEIAAIEDDAVVLETSPGVTTRWAKAAVARVLTDTESEPVDEADPGTTDEHESTDMHAATDSTTDADKPDTRSE
ncbi:MAG: preprotein translocase subunit YajC [Actinomycetes bacterium]